MVKEPPLHTSWWFRRSYVLKSFTAGSLGAIIGGLVTHPIDLVKVRLQIHGLNSQTCTMPSAARNGGSGQAAVEAVKPRTTNHNLLSMGYRVATVEGIPALYKGLSASLIRQVSFIGSKFTAYSVFRSSITKINPLDPADTSRPGQISMVTKATSGLLAGVVGGICGNPADMVMVRMQADGNLPAHLKRGYKHAGDGFLRVVRDEGLFTLWRGSGPTVARSMIITAAQLAIYDEAKCFGRKTFNMSDGATLHTFAAAASSLAASGTSNPIDVCKTRLQSMNPMLCGRLPYTGLADCLIQTIRHEGVKGLYKGLGATFARQLPLNTIRFIAYEKFMKMFGCQL